MKPDTKTIRERRMKPDTKTIRARADAATKGPWRVSSTGFSVKSSSDDMPIVTQNPWGSAMSKDSQIVPWLDNAGFIAAARADVPALCDRVEELERLASRLASLLPAELATDDDLAMLARADLPEGE